MRSICRSAPNPMFLTKNASCRSTGTPPTPTKGVVRRVPVNTATLLVIEVNGIEKDPNGALKPVFLLKFTNSITKVPVLTPDGLLAATLTEYVVLGWIIATLY